jgi:NTE family protein
LYDYTSKYLEAFLSSAIFGNAKLFKPRWCLEYAGTDPERWTYLYDHSPLAKTLENYVDFEELKPNGNPNSRLIMTAVDVLTSEPLIFDTCGYPLYYLPWVQIKNGVYAWDGSLLSNTPLREVIEASPVNDKRVFLVENYPKKIMNLPENLSEVLHRTRDIIFCDKTLSTVKMSKVITRCLEYIDELYHLIENHVDLSKVDKVQLDKIRVKYKRYKQETGAEIKALYYISRDEVVHSIYENANFSPEAIKNSIREGELNANKALEST